MVKLLKRYCPRWVKTSLAKLRHRGIILMYHRIHDGQLDPHHLNVSPSHFHDHMRIIKKYAKLVSVDDIAHHASSRMYGGNYKIAVTFDDGFADNFYNAKPVLEQYEIPATFYISSYAIESQREYWWDRIAQVLAVEHLPHIFEMSIEKAFIRWKLNGEVGNREPQLTDDQPLFNSVVSRKELLFFIWRLLRPLPFAEQEKRVEDLIQWAGRPSCSLNYWPMSLDQLQKIADCPLFEIGAHTVYHPLLSARSVIEQQEEIDQGRRILEQWINKKVTSFAYPYGDYTSDTLGILKRLGFKNACTVVSEPVGLRMDPYLLPRFMVFNWNGEQFEKQLRTWASTWSF